MLRPCTTIMSRWPYKKVASLPYLRGRGSYNAECNVFVGRNCVQVRRLDGAKRPRAVRGERSANVGAVSCGCSVNAAFSGPVRAQDAADEAWRNQNSRNVAVPSRAPAPARCKREPYVRNYLGPLRQNSLLSCNLFSEEALSAPVPRRRALPHV